MATDNEQSPQRRIEDHHPAAKIDWSQPEAPAVPLSSTAGAAKGGVKNNESGASPASGSVAVDLDKLEALAAKVDAFPDTVQPFVSMGGQVVISTFSMNAEQVRAVAELYDALPPRNVLDLIALARSNSPAGSTQPEQSNHIAGAIEEVANELEDEAIPYEGDFADTVRGCVESLRCIADLAQSSQGAASGDKEQAAHLPPTEPSIMCEERIETLMAESFPRTKITPAYRNFARAIEREIHGSNITDAQKIDADATPVSSAAASTASVAAPDLHNAIVNLPCDASRYDAEPKERLAYKNGHRDARHAAAELVAASESESDVASVAALEGLTRYEVVRLKDGMCEVPAPTTGRYFRAEDVERLFAAAGSPAQSEKFGDWLAREMPAGTVISDPAWWAPKILRAAAGSASTAAATNQWISVETRMPEPGGLYLVDSSWGVRPAWRHDPQWARGCFQDAVNNSDEGMTDFNGHCAGVFRVTHWMPLPEAPRTSTKDQNTSKGGDHE